ncbi:MAG: TolC family protein [Paludibacteraceae bacterium]|nr:TolC family protein [Paludibacteraceae bacterium]
MKKVFLLIVASICLLPLSAQDSIRRQSVTLAEAQQLCLEHNRQLKNASLDVQKSEAARWQTIASMLPQAQMGLDYSNMCGYKLNMGGFEIPMNPSGTINITASIALSGAQIVGALIQNIAVEMSDITAKQTEQNTLSNVTYSYMSILAMEQTVDLLKKNLGNMNELQNFTNEAVRVGVSERTEADKLAVQVASMRSSINQTERMLEVLYNSFALQLGAGISVRYEPSQTIEELLNAEEVLKLLKTDLSLDKNYTYQLLEQNTKLSKNQVTLAAMDYLPTVSAFYQYSAKTYFGKDQGMNMTPPNAVGVSATVPLWSSGRRAASVHEKKLAYQEALNNQEDMRDNLLIQDKQLKFNLSSSYENFLIQKDNMDVSLRVFQNISEKFAHGYSSSLEVTTASTELIAAQNNYINALLEVVNAQLELRKLLNVYE